jgi:heat shock protein HtpX
VYDQIAQNKRKTWILISLFGIVIVAIGWALGVQFESPEGGIIVAAIVATTMTLIGYFKGDSVALATAGAKKIEHRDHLELYSMIENLAITAGLPTPDIYLIDDSSPNAFATGRDPEHASVAVTTGLLSIMNKSELEGVLAHELSHVKNYDIRIMTLVVVLVGSIVLLSDIALRSFWFRGRSNNRQGGQAALILFLIAIALTILSPLIAEFIKLAVSRSREYLADASSALLTRYPDGLASALEKIAKHDKPLKRANHATAHLFLANPFDPHVKKRFERLFSTHPPIEERITKLREMTA